MQGEFVLIDYKIPEGLTHKHLYLEYKGERLKPILPNSFVKGRISNIIDKFYIEWEYNIGEILKDELRNITIIDRFREKDSDGYYRKYYRIKCNICGFDSSSYYIKGEYNDSWKVSENDLKRKDKKRVNCPCCSSHIVVPGINDIITTDKWMIQYFLDDISKAQRYSSGSNVKLHFKCPYCGRKSTKKKSISELKQHGLNCVCSDNISYPNKFAYFLFEELKNQYEYYENEYSPDWAKNYKYDNYIVINNRKIIVEMDGCLGHGKVKFGSNERDTDGIKRDIIKDNLAKEHGIELFRIDCSYSKKDYIKNNIIKELRDIFNFEYVHWDEIDVKSKYKNFYKDICEYYNKTNSSIRRMQKVFNLGFKMISSALEVGNTLGWCNYIPSNKFDIDKFNDLIKYWNTNPYTRTSILSKKFGLNQSTIITYLKKASENNLCDYDPKKSIEFEMKNRPTYPIFVYDSNMKLLKSYKSSSECEKMSENDFGVKLNKRNIDYVCTGKSKHYKGFYFSRIKI